MKVFAESKTTANKRELLRASHRFALLVLIAVSFAFSQVTYSTTGWSQWTGDGPWGSALHLSSTANSTATIQDTGTEAFIIHKMGSDCGILQAVVDGNTASMKEIDTYSPLVLWNKKSVIASNLANGPHTITVTVTGRKNNASSGALVQIIDKWILGRGMWTTEKAWAWYKSKPWIVGWNYTPSTCVNAIEWWQDESHVSDSSIHRELKLAEQLGYNSIIVYLPYVVWVKDSAYLKNRFSRFLTIAASHHFSVAPCLFDDVDFNKATPTLGDQGQPNPGLLMSQWTADPGTTLIAATAEWPKFKRYLQDFLRTYGQDGRILMWDIYNEPHNSFPLVEQVFQWAREIGPSQPLTVSEWSSQSNSWPYNLSDICSFHGYMNGSGLSDAINKFRATQRPIICTEWLARGNPGTDILKDLPLFKRLGVGCFSWGLVNGRMHCERSWTAYGSYNDPWFHDILYNSGKPYRAEEVDAIRRNHAHKTINWTAGATDGSIVQKNGCTDPRYAQYDSMATVDNGSCSTLLPALVIRGCLDSTSKNHNPLATQNDPAMCAVVAVSAPSVEDAVKAQRRESFGFIGGSRIRIAGWGAARVELFGSNGRLVWSGRGEAPCTIDIGKSLKSGVYFARVYRNGLNAGVSPLFTVSDPR